MLCYDAHAGLLRKMLPSTSGALEWKIGFSGPEQRTKYERPNALETTFELNPRMLLADVTGDDANEAGAPEQAIRNPTGYSRSPPNLTTGKWNVSAEPFGARVYSNLLSWYNQTTWNRKGDWTPANWDEEVFGPYPQPYKWEDCKPWEGDHGFPWCTPRVHPDWFEDGWGVSSSHTPWTVSGYPVGIVLVTQKVGSTLGLFGAARIMDPTHWRWDATIRGRYSFDLGGAMLSPIFLHHEARWVFSGTSLPWSTPWKILPCQDGATGIDRLASVADLTPAFAVQNLPAWDVTAYSAGPPEVLPYASLSSALDSWQNTGEVDITVRSIAVYAYNTVTEVNELLFWAPVTEAVIPPGDTFSLIELRFSIEELIGV